MRTKELIGKKIDVTMLERVSDDFSLPEEAEHDEIPGKYSKKDLDALTDFYYDFDQFTRAEIELNDYEQDDYYDKHGYNKYSLRIIVDGDKIVKIMRMAHCHEHDGGGSDDILTRFPYNSLEAEAGEYMSRCLLVNR